MKEPKWTREQLEAITEKGRNILVAAAAGAGKTAVLVERIIRKITDAENPIDIDRLLVVTFTNAAAAEMRERIGKAISEEIEKNPSSRRLQKQLTLLNRASITTIHSFCLEVIRNNFHILDLDPDFRIVDETEALLMRMEAIEELFEQKYEKEMVTEEFLELVDCYGGNRDDSYLQEMVLKLYNFVQSNPWPQKWLNDSVNALNIDKDIDFSKTKWAEIIISGVKIELEGLRSLMEEAVRDIKDSLEFSTGLEPYIAIFSDELSSLSLLLRNIENDASWDTIYNSIRNITFERLPRCGKDADKEIKNHSTEVRDSVKKYINKLKEDIFVYDSHTIAEDLVKLYPLMSTLSDLVLEFTVRYAAKKRDKALIDFNDIEHFCLEILIRKDEDNKESLLPTDIALALREKFEEILIDEYQDSNLVQEYILTSISRKDLENPNIFMVGDVKQSIYRFRQSRPELFMEKYNSYLDETGSGSRKILLYKNFRSRKEIINGVNFVFKKIMSKNVGELDYNEKEALMAGLEYKPPEWGETLSGEIELNLIDLKDYEIKNGENSKDGFATGETDGVEGFDDINDEGEKPINTIDEEEAPGNIQAEARMVVKRIRDLISGTEDKGQYLVFDKSVGDFRPLKYKDIVILMRATRNRAEIFEEEFSLAGIPCFADTGTGYFKTIEVQTVMSLLQIIDNPMQDIPLLSVLRSPIGSFDTEELIDIKATSVEGTYFESMQGFVLNSKEEAAKAKTVKKLSAFMDSLSKWRENALFMSTDELIWYLYNETGYYSFVAAMPGGIQRQANLRMLFERARQYEGTSYRGLFNFINFINRLKSSQGDMGSAKIIGENEDVVRIMSIHKSKGLEFPVVILSGCGKKFNMMDLNGKILLHQDLGFGPDFIDSKRRITYTTPAKQALKFKMKVETLSEEMRILYVALTRAREKLIITGAVKDIEKTTAAWNLRSADKVKQADDAKLQEYHLLNAKSYLDWIGPAIIRQIDCKTGNGGSFWKVITHGLKEVILEVEEIKKEGMKCIELLKEIQSKEEHSPYTKEINNKLDWSYDYKILNRLPTKLSITELKKYFNSEGTEEYTPQGIIDSPVIRKPHFLEEDRDLSSAEKGTALHFVMQHLDIEGIRSSLLLSKGSTEGSDDKQISTLKNELRRQLVKMASDELISQQQSKVVNLNKIGRFFLSSIGKRMLNSEKVAREAPFNMEFKLIDLYNSLPKDIFNLKDSISENDISKASQNIFNEETILLQGVIDCYFEENDEIILLDYKTDYVPVGGSDSIKEKYKIQIDYYSLVLEKITGKKVKEKCIYLFWNGEVIEYSSSGI